MKKQTLLKSFLLIIFFISIFDYALDCIINFDYAIKNIDFLWVYFIYYLIVRSWLILILLVIYTLTFKKLYEPKFILFKIIFIIVMSTLYANYFYMDDYSLIIDDVKKIKLMLAFALSGLSVMMINELYLSRKKHKAYI